MIFRHVRIRMMDFHDTILLIMLSNLESCGGKNVVFHKYSSDPLNHTHKST